MCGHCVLPESVGGCQLPNPGFIGSNERREEAHFRDQEDKPILSTLEDFPAAGWLHWSPHGSQWISPFPNLKTCKQPPDVSITTNPQFPFLSHSHWMTIQHLHSSGREDGSNSVSLQGSYFQGSIWPLKQKRKTLEETSVMGYGCAMVLTGWLQLQDLQISAPGARLGFITRLTRVSSLPSTDFSTSFRNERIVSLFLPLKSAFVWSALLWKSGKKTFQKKLESKETQQFLYIIHMDSATYRVSSTICVSHIVQTWASGRSAQLTHGWCEQVELLHPAKSNK